MAAVVGILLVALVVAVVIDIVRRVEKPLPKEAASTTQKIVVDLSKRG